MTFDAAGAVWFVLETSLRALAVAAAVALILRLLRIRAAAVVHSAWSLVLFAMLLMPVLPSMVPALPVPVPVSAGSLFGAVSGTEAASPDVVGEAPPSVNRINTVPSSHSGDSVRLADRMPAVAGRARESRSWLPLMLLGVYAAGVLLLVAQLVYGWSLASAMMRRATRGGPIGVDGAKQVYQSSDVTVPMTVGALRPIIVLPVTWTTWDADTLAAVVAHEAAHVRRHDASINLAADLNRAIFWFHPLAWWVRRTLALTAEHVCDEAAARAIAVPRRYAEILVDMADAVRRNRGRLAWQAVGVHGGLLDRRIDRLLRGDVFATASRAKQITAGIGCVLAIAMAVACRHQLSAAPLRADPEVAKMMAYRDGQTKRFDAARDMTQAQADALEQRILANAEDFDARWQLVTYYRMSRNVAWDKKVPGLRRHALWLIEHQPEHDEVEPPALSPQFDPEGFAAAKKLWEVHLARPDASPFLVSRAVSFFAPYDKPYAEQLILRGMAMDPDSAALKARMQPDAGGYQWPIQLSSLYAAALRGSESVWGGYNDLRTHPDKVNSPYAMDVRRKLEATTDAALLTSVSSVLTRPYSLTKDPAEKAALEQAHALGVAYLERALQLDPNLAFAKGTLVRIRLRESPTEADRLANRAAGTYELAHIRGYLRKDWPAAQQQHDEAKARAAEVLTIAAPHAQDPAYSAAVMTAHQVLATIALRAGDRERAVYHLRESVKVPASDRIQYAPPYTWTHPVNQLLKAGERERVVEFLEAFARLSISERDRVLKDAQAIREGRMPASYQYVVAREGQ